MPCPEHTREPWGGSPGRSRLPGSWTSIAAAVLERDPDCQIAYPGQWHAGGRLVHCTGISTEVDHKGNRDDHRRHMLRGACSNCHTRRTQEQSRAARRVVDAASNI